MKRGETPVEAAERELVEEIGLQASLRDPAIVVTGSWDGRAEVVHVFRLALDRLRALQLDNREIVGARLVPWGDVAALPVTGALAAYLQILTTVAE